MSVKQIIPAPLGLWIRDRRVGQQDVYFPVYAFGLMADDAGEERVEALIQLDRGSCELVPVSFWDGEGAEYEYMFTPDVPLGALRMAVHPSMRGESAG